MQKPIAVFVIYNIIQQAQMGNPNHPGLLEIITNWPEGENFGLSLEHMRNDPHF